MKYLQLTVLATLLLGSMAAQAGQPIINLSVSGEISPGVYGQVQFGNAPPPPVVYAQPRIIARQSRGAEMAPLYLHVPPGHAKKWSKHCREYNACDREVYFVKSEEYEPGYSSRKNREHGDGEHGDRRGGEDRGDEGGGNEGRGHGHKGKGHRD